MSRQAVFTFLVLCLISSCCHGFTSLKLDPVMSTPLDSRPRILLHTNAPAGSRNNRMTLTKLCSKQEDNDDVEPVIVRGFEQDEISDQAWENIETGEPPKWIIMKEVSVVVWGRCSVSRVCIVENILLPLLWCSLALFFRFWESMSLRTF